MRKWCNAAGLPHCSAHDLRKAGAKIAGAKTCKGGPCPIRPTNSNFHAVWDSTLIKATTWSWGAYVDRLEDGWLTSQEAQNVDGGTPAAWAEETHREARYVWDQLPDSRVVDDAYYGTVLPSLDRQLGPAGLRLAHFLNEAYGSSCAAH